jgi:hypothetical protein
VRIRVGVVVTMLAVAACSGPSSNHIALAPTAVQPAHPIATSSTPPPAPPAPTVRLVAWHGPVEELFVHPLVIRPRLAFTPDTLGVGFQNYFVTALEFRRILDQLWRKGWTLVDIHDAAAGTVRVPAGRRPLVLEEDDVNYYRYFQGRGLAKRLVLADGDVQAELPNGNLTDQDVVPLVEREVALHPEFSADGAKGVLGLTGYEGLFGEHHATTPAARKRLRALVHWLVGHGWTIASHTWGHIDLSTNSMSSIAWDTGHWKALADPVIGHTDVLIYPFGARPGDPAVRQLVRAGFRIQLDIDDVARSVHRDGAVVMSRRHVDGYAFDVPAQQRRFYDVATVRDPRRPG